MGLTKPRATQIYDIDYKQATRVISTTNITSLSGGAPATVDGVGLSVGDRVLVTGQSTASQNGLYYVTTLGSGSNGTWARTSDTNETGELEAGTIVMVTEGTIYHDTQWKLTTNNPIVIGTSDLVFEQNSAFAFGNVYANSTAVLATTVGDVLTLTAGNNISITGNNISKSVKFDVTQNISVTGNIVGANLSLTGNVLDNLNVSGNVASTYFLGNANVQYTAATTPPGGNLIGAQWYNTSTDVLYEWQSDGTSTYWIDVSGPVYGTNGVVTGSAITNGTSNVTVALSGSVGVSVAGTSNVVLFRPTGETVTGNLIVNYTPATAIGTGLLVTAANTQGGTGYADFLRATNTSTGATNANKTFRLSSTGGLEIIDSAYTSTLLALSDGGNLTVSGKVSASNLNGPAFSAYPSVTQTITSGGLQKVNFATEEYDTNDNFASSRFTPTVAGYYQLNSTVRLDGAVGTGECMIVIYKNGNEYKRGWNSSGTSFAGNFWSMSVSCQALANGSTDYFEVYIQQGSGADRTTTAFTNISWFQGCMIRGA